LAHSVYFERFLNTLQSAYQYLQKIFNLNYAPQRDAGVLTLTF